MIPGIYLHIHYIYITPELKGLQPIYVALVLQTYNIVNLHPVESMLCCWLKYREY